MGREMKEMFMSEVGKCFKEGDSESKCVGRGKMAVVISADSLRRDL